MVAIPKSDVRVSNAALLALKLCGFALMFLDHLDSMVYAGALGIHATAGRVVAPIFFLVLGLNLTRSDDWHRLLTATAPRLAAIGVAATPVYAWIMGWGHFNIMFTLAAAVVAVAFVLRSWYIAAAAVVVAASWTVDYGAWGVVAVVGVWYAVQARLPLVVAASWAAIAVVPVNGSLWSLAAVPLVFLALQFRGDAPRLPWLFWAGYPLHLVLIAALR